MGGIKPPASGAAAPTTLPAQTTPKSTNEKKGFFGTLGRKKAKNLRPDISAPIQSTLVHVNHIGAHESFFKDDSQRQLFEKVLNGLGISNEDQDYVINYIKTTDGGLEKLFEKPAPPPPPPSMQPPPPDLPPRGHQTTARNAGGRAPNQDISVPNRSQPLQDMFNPPSIPPRPGAQTRENTYSSTQAPQAPPPPPPPPPPQPYNPDSNRIQAPPAPPPPPPVNNYTSGGGAPPPPPPPPLPADFGNAPPPPPPPPSANSGSTRPAVPASTGSRDDLLSQIRGFSTTKLKAQTERPALPQVQSSGESSPGVQDTMATNILKILQERREKIIGQDNSNENDDSDGSEDEWST